MARSQSENWTRSHSGTLGFCADWHRFNILSAVITHYFIGLNNDAINLIDPDINGKQVFIDGLWQSRVEVERKREFFIFHFSFCCLLFAVCSTGRQASRQ